MKLRLLPLLATMATASAVLFGGWFVYQTFAMEDPFLQRAAAIEGVADVRVELTRDRAIVSAELQPDARLAEAYRQLRTVAGASFGGRDVTISFAGGGAGGALNEWWSTALFDVAEAMETKQYSLIPKRLNELAGERMTVWTEMDDSNVYVTLGEGPNRKYIVLPRTPAMIGVWPNE